MTGMAMTECEAILSELRANAMPMYFLLSIAAGALVWQWLDDAKRDRICKDCGPCQTKIHGSPKLPPPSSGVAK